MSSDLPPVLGMKFGVSDGHPGTKGVLRLKEDCMGKVTHLKSKGERWKENTLNVEPLLNVGVEHKLN